MCGSLKFVSDIMYWTEKLTLEGNCVLSIIYPTRQDKGTYTPEQHDLLNKMHKKKIDLSDSIFVVNRDGYIGSSTRSEIDYAKALGKEILYLDESQS